MNMTELSCYLDRGHLVIDDGCDLDVIVSTIENNDIAAQSHNHSLRMDENGSRTRHLVYINWIAVGPIFLYGDGLKVKCPKCEKTYEITRDMLPQELLVDAPQF